MGNQELGREQDEPRFERMSTHDFNPLILLASASPRRSELLRQLGVAHQARPMAIDETPQLDEPPRDYVRRLARCKAEALWELLPATEIRPVLGADTAVVLDAQILGKPRDAADHAAMLRQLSGRAHEVHTAVALRYHGGIAVRLSVSEVCFRALQALEIEAYWRTGEASDKAGGYAIQGRGAMFVTHISGSYSGIVGLPLLETSELLQLVGWSPLGSNDCIEVARCG